MIEADFAEEFPHLLEEARVIARYASNRLREFFPKWETQTEAVFGSPARVVLEKADEWRPDLIVVGSHGRSALGRLLLGSVSQKVVTEAGCSVRIARGGAISEPGSEVRIIVGVDGSEGAAAAVQAVAARQWPERSAARSTIARRDRARRRQMINGLGEKQARQILREQQCGRLGCCLDGEPVEFPPSPAWDRTRALAALDIREVPFTDLDGNTLGYARGREIAISPLSPMPHETTFANPLEQIPSITEHTTRTLEPSLHKKPSGRE
jgi:hypothetical protein